MWALEVTAMTIQENECGTSELGSCWYPYLLTNVLVSELRDCEGLRTHASTHTHTSTNKPKKERH